MAGIMKDGKAYASVNPTGYVAKTDIATAINSTCTNEQVPSAKAVYDNVSDLKEEIGNIKNYYIVEYPDLSSTNTINTFADILKLVPVNKTWYIVSWSDGSLNTGDAREAFGIPREMNYWGTITVTCRKRPGYTDAEGNQALGYFIELQTNYASQFSKRWVGEATSKDETDNGTTIPAYTVKWKKLITDDLIESKLSWKATDAKIPSSKACLSLAYGIKPTNDVVTSAENDVLKFPLGKWLIYSTAFAKTLLNLPRLDGGILQVLDNSLDEAYSPFTNKYSIRMYRYNNFAKGEWIRYMYSGDTPGVMAYDSGWQKVCTTKVADVPITGISSSNSNITLGSNSCYSVVNGICHVTIWDFKGLATGNNLVVSTSLPKSKQLVGTNIIGANNGGDNIGFISVSDDGKLYAHVYTTNVMGYCSFTYPVAES